MENILFYGGIGAMGATVIAGIVILPIFRNKTKRLNKALDETYGKAIQIKKDH